MQYGISDFQVLSVSEKVEYTLTENIRLSNVEKLWELGYDGEGMHIAVLDTGCDVNHECLKDRIVETKNFINGTDDVTDRNGHGTHVAGIIAGNQCEGGISGIAPKASLHIYKVLSDNGLGDTKHTIRAIEHAIEQKVDVINMSLGGRDPLPVMKEVIQKAIDNGISVVCASGNDARGDNGSKDEINYPAYYRECISVGSVTKKQITSKFSNSNFNVDLVAYGSDICSCYPNNKYATCSGTSQATPMVSGFLVLLKQKFMKEFGREPECESELYAQLIKNTKTLKNVDRRVQGNGLIYFREGE